MSRFLVLFLLAMISSGSEGYFRRVCESQSMAINCHSKVINILSASYGRTQRGICGFRHNRNTNCHAGSSMMVAKYECQGQSRCILHAKPSAFGIDPCHGTLKYLEVRYECVPKSQICFQDSVLLRICGPHSQIISCPSNKPKINIISANYGRLTGGHICGGPVRTTNCGAAGSLDKVKRFCQGKRSCYLRASHLIYGDPCFGTLKYLEVRYRCER